MTTFNSNPNQRHITIAKELCDTQNLYAKINLSALQHAMHTLTPKAFELWIYFSKNQDGHKFYLSKVDFLNWSNVSASSYKNAFDELKDRGYLIPIDKEKAEPLQWNFYEVPTVIDDDLPVQITVNKA